MYVHTRYSVTNNNRVSGMEAKRAQVIDELIATERSYVKSLRVIVDVYDKPLRDREKSNRGKILDKAELDTLFLNIVEILRVNERLVKDLTTAKVSDSIGEALKRFIPFFKM
jgi:hypothetical protein